MKITVFLDSSVGLATGYGFDGRASILGRARDFSLLNSVQTGSGAHPASYLMCIGGPFLEGKAAGGLKLTTRLHLVPRSKMVELYLHPMRLYGVVLN
jgi:hypothetical protein